VYLHHLDGRLKTAHVMNDGTCENPKWYVFDNILAGCQIGCFWQLCLAALGIRCNDTSSGSLCASLQGRIFHRIDVQLCYATMHTTVYFACTVHMFI
jgi:hypothetical protein